MIDGPVYKRDGSVYPGRVAGSEGVVHRWLYLLRFLHLFSSLQESFSDGQISERWGRVRKGRNLVECGKSRSGSKSF